MDPHHWRHHPAAVLQQQQPNRMPHHPHDCGSGGVDVCSSFPHSHKRPLSNHNNEEHQEEDEYHCARAMKRLKVTAYHHIPTPFNNNNNNNHNSHPQNMTSAATVAPASFPLPPHLHAAPPFPRSSTGPFSLQRSVTSEELMEQPQQPNNKLQETSTTSTNYQHVNSFLGQLHLQRRQRAQQPHQPPSSHLLHHGHPHHATVAHHPPSQQQPHDLVHHHPAVQQQPPQHAPYQPRKVKLPSNTKIG